jgi:hypothetical protein
MVAFKAIIAYLPVSDPDGAVAIEAQARFCWTVER